MKTHEKYSFGLALSHAHTAALAHAHQPSDRSQTHSHEPGPRTFHRLRVAVAPANSRHETVGWGGGCTAPWPEGWDPKVKLHHTQTEQKKRDVTHRTVDAPDRGIRGIANELLTLHSAAANPHQYSEHSKTGGQTQHNRQHKMTPSRTMRACVRECVETGENKNNSNTTSSF